MTDNSQQKTWPYVCGCGSKVMVDGPEYRNPGIIEHWRDECSSPPRGYHE